MGWNPNWDKYDKGGILRKAYNGYLVLEVYEYRTLRNHYLDYINMHKANLPDLHKQMLIMCSNRGIFACISSQSPYACILDGQCASLGVKTAAMLNQKPCVDILSSGNISAIGSVVDGTNIRATGMIYDKDPQAGEIWVGLGEDGIILPKTNEQMFEIFSIALIITSLLIILACAIGIGVSLGPPLVLPTVDVYEKNINQIVL